MASVAAEAIDALSRKATYAENKNSIYSKWSHLFAT